MRHSTLFQCLVMDVFKWRGDRLFPLIMLLTGLLARFQWRGDQLFPLIMLLTGLLVRFQWRTTPPRAGGISCALLNGCVCLVRLPQSLPSHKCFRSSWNRMSLRCNDAVEHLSQTRVDMLENHNTDLPSSQFYLPILFLPSDVWQW